MALTLNGDTGVSLVQDNVVATADMQDNAVNSNKLADALTFQSITETQTTKSASFTPSMTAEGTVYSCTGTMTITMPTATIGKSFTIIHATGNTITWGGTIKWNGGAEPDKGTGIDMYVFYSDGSHWYGMQAGTGFA